MFDYTQSKNETAAKIQARKDLTSLFYEFLKEKFGDDKVGYVDSNTIGFIFGIVNDRDGYPCDFVATTKVVLKPYQDHIGEKRQAYAFDFFQAIEDYKYEMEEEEAQ